MNKVETVANEILENLENGHVEVKNGVICIYHHPVKWYKATEKQVAYLDKLIDRYNISSLMGLSVAEASTLIDYAKSGYKIYIENKY